MTNGKGGRRNPAARTAFIDSKNTQLATRIRDVRKKRMKMNQKALAKLLGVSHATISYWERGGTPSEDNLKRFAEATGEDFRTLVGKQRVFVSFDWQETPLWHEILALIESRSPADEVGDVLDSVRDFLEILLRSRDAQIEAQKRREKRMQKFDHDDA